MNRLILLLAAALLLLGAHAAADTREAAPCHPSFRELGNRWLRVNPPDVTTWEATTKAVLIGCRKDLETLSEEQIRQIGDLLGKKVVEAGFALQDLRSDLAYRNELCNVLNYEIGRQVVSDIYFLDLSYTNLIGH